MTARDITLYGWGFRMSGGSDVGSKLRIIRVSQVHSIIGSSRLYSGSATQATLMPSSLVQTSSSPTLALRYSQ